MQGSVELALPEFGGVLGDEGRGAGDQEDHQQHLIGFHIS
jgi:hypothetical protein